MVWVKLDDQFTENPKVVQAGPLASWLHVCGLVYCSRNLTDGFIPAMMVPRLTNFDHRCYYRMAIGLDKVKSTGGER